MSAAINASKYQQKPDTMCEERNKRNVNIAKEAENKKERRNERRKISRRKKKNGGINKCGDT
jgi:hypothetical protein